MASEYQFSKADRNVNQLSNTSVNIDKSGYQSSNPNDYIDKTPKLFDLSKSYSENYNRSMEELRRLRNSGASQAEIDAKQEEMFAAQRGLQDTKAQLDIETQRGAANAKATSFENRKIDQGAYDLMRGAAEGNAPSQAQLTLQNESQNLANAARRQGNQMFNQNQSMVNSARTYNPAMARAAMFQNASQQADLSGRTLEGQQSLAGQAAAMRAQEMASARGAYGQYALNQAQQNDAQANAIRQQNLSYDQLKTQGSIAYNQAKLANAAQKNAQNLGSAALQNQADIQSEKNMYDFVGGGIGGAILSDERIKNNISKIGSTVNGLSDGSIVTDKIEPITNLYQNIPSASSDAISGIPETLPEKNKSGVMGLVGTIASLISDERSKQKIGPVESVSDQLSEVEPVTFDYKKGYGPAGDRVGVIAQDLERTPVGKTMITSKEVGGKKMKAIDPNAAVSTLLANAAEQAKRIKELENRTGVGAVSNDDRPSLIATGENHPLTGRPILRTPSGDVATEMGITVTDPRLNGGKPTNLPSIWGMQALGDREAVTEALKSGQKFASYKSIPAAVKASKEHSAELGRYLDESGHVRRDDISNGPIIPAPDGVSIKTNGSTVLVDDNVPGTQFFSPKKKYQGGQTLSPSDAKNLFKVIGAENKRMDRQPAMQLFEQNPPYVPQDAARYGREMMQYAQALKKRPGGIM